MPIDEPRTVDELARLLDRERTTISGRQTRVYHAADWTLAECGMACGQMPRKVYCALRYSYGLDDAVRSELWAALFQWAMDRREIEQWPETVKTIYGKDRRYMDDLVRMSLLEERAPWCFVRKPNEPDRRRLLMGVAEHTWRRRLSGIYEAIRGEYIGWLGIGERFMRERLRG